MRVATCNRRLRLCSRRLALCGDAPPAACCFCDIIGCDSDIYCDRGSRFLRVWQASASWFEETIAFSTTLARNVLLRAEGDWSWVGRVEKFTFDRSPPGSPVPFCDVGYVCDSMLWSRARRLFQDGSLVASDASSYDCAYAPEGFDAGAASALPVFYYADHLAPPDFSAGAYDITASPITGPACTGSFYDNRTFPAGSAGFGRGAWGRVATAATWARSYSCGTVSGSASTSITASDSRLPAVLPAGVSQINAMYTASSQSFVNVVDPCHGGALCGPDNPPPPPPPPEPTGGCSFPDGTCCNGMTPTACNSMGGIWNPACPPGVYCNCANSGLGACILWSRGGQCVRTTESVCARLRGLFVGTGSNCPAPTNPGGRPGSPILPPGSIRPDIPNPGDCLPSVGGGSRLVLPPRRGLVVAGCAGCGNDGGL